MLSSYFKRIPLYSRRCYVLDLISMYNEHYSTMNNSLKQDFIFFEELFHIYYCPLLAFVNKYVNDKQAAEDIVQDVFLATWMQRDNIDFQKPIKPYLYKAAYNRSISYLNALQESLPIDEENIKLQLQLKIISYDQQDSFSVKEISEEISSCVNTLPEQCRRVFRLSREQGLKNKEIAQLLNISEKTVEGHISKALAELRSHLKKLDLFPSLAISILYQYLS